MHTLLVSTRTIFRGCCVTILAGLQPLGTASTPPPVNSVFEITALGSVLGPPRQLDDGPPGALSGIVATVGGEGNQIVYSAMPTPIPSWY
jgi:hypothetical protein